MFKPTHEGLWLDGAPTVKAYSEWQHIQRIRMRTAQSQWRLTTGLQQQLAWFREVSRTSAKTGA